MENTITAPAGAETYTDALGRTQWSVTGPNGTYLVTRSDQFSPYKVWLSNSLNTAYQSRDLQAALNAAARHAGTAS